MADSTDPAAHGATVAKPFDQRASLAASANLVQAAVMVVAFLAVAAGAIMVVVGKLEQDGGFREAAYTYDLRSPGIVIVALGLLLGPVSWLVARAIEVWAKS